MNLHSSDQFVNTLCHLVWDKVFWIQEQTYCTAKKVCLPHIRLSLVDTTNDDENNRLRALHCIYWSGQHRQGGVMAAWRQSCLVDNSCGLIPRQTAGHIDILTHFYLPRGASGGGYDSGNRISSAKFLIVFPVNNGSIFLGFLFEIWPQDGQRQTTDQWQALHIWPYGGVAISGKWSLNETSVYIPDAS